MNEFVVPARAKRGSNVNRCSLTNPAIKAVVTKVRTIFCLVFFAPLAPACVFSIVQAEPVRLAYSAISGAMAPLWVAQDYGYFRRQGLDVQLLYIGGGSVVTQALIGGDVQFVRLGANSVVQASLRGASLKMIGNTINTLVFSLIARPENQTPKDLKGEKNRRYPSRRLNRFCFGSSAQTMGNAPRFRGCGNPDGWHAATARGYHRRGCRCRRGVAAYQLDGREAWPQGAGGFRRNRYCLPQLAIGHIPAVLGQESEHGLTGIARLLRRHSSSQDG